MYLANVNRLPTCFRFCAKGWGIARKKPGSVSASEDHSLVGDGDKERVQGKGL